MVKLLIVNIPDIRDEQALYTPHAQSVCLDQPTNENRMNLLI